MSGASLRAKKESVLAQSLARAAGSAGIALLLPANDYRVFGKDSDVAGVP